MAYIKPLVAAMVAVVLVVGVSPAGASDAFPDVGDTHPFHDEIAWLADSGITTGYDDGTFRPTRVVTRQAIAAYLYRYAGEPAFTPPATPTFPDVPTSHPFYKEIEWLASTGTTTGYNDGTFRSNSAVSRQAIAAYFYRYNGEPAFTPPATPTFPDVPTSHPFYKEIEWLASTGITTGYGDGTFRPTRPVSRQAIAAYLYRYDEAFGEPCGTQIQTQIPQTECDALVALYDATNGPGWNTNTNWLTTNTPCDWYGVVCASGTNVTGLSFYGNNLTGTIPTQIGNLTNLTSLILADNGLTGTIPTQIGNLTNLTNLDLRRNALSGTIPAEIGNLTNLTRLDLTYSDVTGTIPAQIGNLTNLTRLELSYNDLTGTIPAQIGNLTNLTFLTLNGNALTGTIPAQIGNLTNLTFLTLNGNALTGMIPAQIGDLTNLVVLFLDGNALSGPVPVEFTNLTNLLDLNLWTGSGNGCFTSSSAALTTFLVGMNFNWDGGCA